MNTMQKSKLPPGPKSKTPLDFLFSFRHDSINFLKQIANEYGDIVHFKIGPIRIVLLNHPDLIKEVLSTQHNNFIKGRPLAMARKLIGNGLLTSEGDFHKHQSRIIQPAFHRKMIETYAPAMTECTIQLINGWKDGMQLNIMEEMIKLSIAIAGKAMFNTEIKEVPEIMEAFNTATSLFARIAVPFSEWLLKLPVPSTIRFYKAKAQLDNVINRIIEEHRSGKADNGDLISILLQSQDGKEGGEKMSDQQVRDEALTLFVTAFDTTSTALTWTWYLLSQNPDVEYELHKELDCVLQGRVPTIKDLAQLQFTRMVFAESMRIYPPSYIIARQALEAFSIDKYIVPRGTLILMSPYLIHHDGRFHREPDKFNPHRWDKQSQGQNSKYEYFPFGGGPRSCIGEPFAWMQGVLVLATIAKSWRVRLIPNHPIELLQLVNLRSKHGMMMTVHGNK